MESLAKVLESGIASGFVRPFQTKITDQNGVLRNDGTEDFSSAALMDMDWLCNNVEGRIPTFEELIPDARDTVRLIGLHREQITPEKENEQL